jgi:predicted nucleic acid-binding protein
MTALYFVDTDILVYARDPRREPNKHRQAREWMTWLWQERTGRTSTQVLNEYYAVTTQKLKPPLPIAEARIEIRTLFAWQPHAFGPATIEQAWNVQTRYRFNWWDALIIAAAQLSGCEYLLTEDLQPEQEIDGLKIMNPFEHQPLSRG